jgi:hypothetical protein
MAERKASINLAAVPQLRNSSNVAAWRNAMETQFLLAGVKGIIDASDTEPNRRIEIARTQRAGSVMPSGMEAESHEATPELGEAWKKWQRREDLAQGMIRGTVSDGILVDLLDCHSAKEMWDFALETNSLEDPETQAEIWNEIARLRLPEDPTAQQMENHMEQFNGLLLKASYAGLVLRETERIDRFLVTLPKSFEVFRMQFRVSNRLGRSWMTVRKEFDREQNTRGSRARIEEEDQQHASVMAMKGQRKDRGKRDMTNVKCYNCQMLGHIARECKKDNSQKQTDSQENAKAMTMSHWAMALTSVQDSPKAVPIPKRWMWDEDYGISCVEDTDQQCGDALLSTSQCSKPVSEDN